MSRQASAPFRHVPFIERDIDVECRADGSLIVRNRVPLRTPPPHIPSLLRRQSQQRTAATWLAQRKGEARQWHRLGYGEARLQVDAVTQALLNLGQTGRNILVLSGNSIEHGVLALAAMQARMPFAPVTPAYSLLSQDHGKLKAMAKLLDPAVVFVQSARQFENALKALDLRRAKVVCVDDPVQGLSTDSWLQWLQTPVRDDDVDGSVAQITSDTVAKYLFTSGSTGIPKAVIMTQRMLCHSLMMAAQLLDPAPQPDDVVMLDWMPWSHVAGGNSVFHEVLYAGGTLHIDDGKPAPTLFDETLRNLRDVSPFRFANVPIGYAMLADALEGDEGLARQFFRKLRTMAYAGARLPDDVYSRLQSLAVRHTGLRIPFVSGFGATETGPSALFVFWPTDRVGLAGLPHPGVELKLLPLDDTRYEMRIRSGALTLGYLEQPELTRAAFDEEGFFRIGDAATFVDREDPREGLVFAGRIAEEFKLVTGSFVRVGELRVQLIDAAAPLAADFVITGADRAFVGALIWPNLGPCRTLMERPEATFGDIAASPLFRERLAECLRRHNQRHPGSSTRIGRVMVLDSPPSMEAGEITDKGYVNQRAVLARRAQAVQRLYADAGDIAVIHFD